MKSQDQSAPALEAITLGDLAAVVGGDAISDFVGPPTPPGAAQGKPSWDEIAKELGNVLDRAIAARPFEKICRESGNCYVPRKSPRRRR